jgi:hypothetical protein
MTGSISNAQIHRCATHHNSSEAISQQLRLAEALEGVITIPVVVHVVYNIANPEENISNQQIYSQIEILNKDYRLNNEDTSFIPSHFRGVAADCEINFCLATKDPSGNPTTGIIRKATTKNNVGSDITEAVKTESPLWDRTKYLNIWVCEIIESGNILGYAYSGSDAITTPNKDGVVIDYRVFGNTGTGTTYIEYAKGRTTTHEIGHYLELIHIWGDDESNVNKCAGTDEIADTPNQSNSSDGCPSGIFTDVCSPNAYGRMYQNYMDYTYDECMAMFTQGQKSRMRQGISTYRTGLLSSNKCTYTSLEDNISLFEVNTFPNPTTDYLHLRISAQETDPIQIIVLDALAQPLLLKTINFKDYNTTNLYVKDLPSGIYWIQLIQGSRTTQKSFVKM